MRVYRIAERNIGIEALYERVHTRCAAYRVEDAPDFVVRTSREDIDRERECSLMRAAFPYVFFASIKCT